MPSLIDRLTAARRRHTAALAELEEAKTELRESAAEIEECLRELETGEPERPLLDAIDAKTAPPGPRGPTDFHGRRQPAPRAKRETADRLTKAQAPDPWAGTDDVRYVATRSVDPVLPAPPPAEALTVTETAPAGGVPGVTRKGVYPARSIDDVPAPKIEHATPARQATIAGVVDDRRVPRPVEGWSDLRLLNALARLGESAVVCEHCAWMRAAPELPCPNCRTTAARPARGELGRDHRRRAKVDG